MLYGFQGFSIESKVNVFYLFHLFCLCKIMLVSMTVSVRLQEIPIKAWSWLAIPLSPFHISCAVGGILPINGVSLGLASRNGLIAHQANINCLLDCSISDPFKKASCSWVFQHPSTDVCSCYLLTMLMCRLCTLFYVELKRWGQRRCLCRTQLSTRLSQTAPADVGGDSHGLNPL